MRLRLAKNSLFAILLRSPWWISFAIAAGVIVVLRLFMPDAYAYFGALPFLIIGSIAAWRQLRSPNAAQVARRLDELRAMSWSDFSAAMEAAFRGDGYAVSRLSGAAADFEMTKAGRTVLVSCKRWKVARTGIDPLRDLYAAQCTREAHECIYVAAGEITDTARTFAAGKKIRLIHGAELARLLPRVGRA